MVRHREAMKSERRMKSPKSKGKKAKSPKPKKKKRKAKVFLTSFSKVNGLALSWCLVARSPPLMYEVSSVLKGGRWQFQIGLGQ